METQEKIIVDTPVDSVEQSMESLVEEKPPKMQNTIVSKEISERKNNNKEETSISGKDITTTNAKEDIPLKKCDKCKREIGKNESVCFFNTLVVCPDCFKRLSQK